MVIPFDDRTRDVRLDRGTPSSASGERLAKFGARGMNCLLPVAKANRELHERNFAGCVLVSDREI